MRAKVFYVALAVTMLTNLVLVAAVIAMTSGASSVAEQLHLPTDDQVARLESQVSDLEFAVADEDLTGRLDDLESRLDDLEVGAGDEAPESVEALSSRIDDLETNLSNLCSLLESTLTDVYCPF